MGRLGQPDAGVAIVGCGLIGHKRAQSLGSARLVGCADVVLDRAKALARTRDGVVATDRVHELMNRSDVDIVIVATPNASLAKIAIGALECGKHVLIEKPAARTTRELESLLEVAQASRQRVRVGFNHRYHPALRKARALCEEGALGNLMVLRGRYGHGGRPGYEGEWRADPALSGGGELIDQGIHLIDLARWFLGDFTHVSGFAHTYYWRMPVEDNAFLLLRTQRQQAAFLHVSCTEWKNLFSLEIYGRDGKLHIEGLGGSYGVERIAFYRMRPGMGPPETTIWEYPMADDSWHVEFEEFLEDIRQNRPPSVGLGDAVAALRVVEKIYSESGYDYQP